MRASDGKEGKEIKTLILAQLIVIAVHTIGSILIAAYFSKISGATLQERLLLNVPCTAGLIGTFAIYDILAALLVY